MSTLTVSTISDGTSSTPTTDVVKGSARAWVNFNGTGTVAIRASYNVSSITDHDTGDYTVNFTTAMPDANYSVAGATLGSSETSSGFLSTGIQNGGTPAAGSVRMTTRAAGQTRVDCSFVQVAIFR